MSKSRKSVHRRDAEDAEEGKGSVGSDLRAMVEQFDRDIHAMARGITGLKMKKPLYPKGLPGVRVGLFGQMYVIEVNANWDGGWAKKERWVRLVEASNALMVTAMPAIEELIDIWSDVIDSHTGVGASKAMECAQGIQAKLKAKLAHA